MRSVPARSLAIAVTLAADLANRLRNVRVSSGIWIRCLIIAHWASYRIGWSGWVSVNGLTISRLRNHGLRHCHGISKAVVGSEALLTSSANAADNASDDAGAN